MKLIILGSGGLSREIFNYVKSISPSCEIIFFDNYTSSSEVKIDDSKIPIINSETELLNWKSNGFESFTVGVGNPVFKAEFVKTVTNIGLRPANSWIHPTATLYTNNIGNGGVIAPGVVVSCDTQIEDYVILNYNCTIGHDTKIGKFVTCNPGSNVSGNVEIGEGCLIGAGSVIREKTKVAPNVTLGAQSCLVKSIDQVGVTLVGVPAKRMNNA